MITSILIALAMTGATAGDQWPAFRGNGDSVSTAENMPLEWSDKKGVAWKTDLPGYGQSSPVVWGGRVFVTCTKGENKEESIVVCTDLQSGKILWQRRFESAQPAKVSNYISRAAPTAAVDEQRVYALFEMGNFVALDHDGEVLWQRSLIKDYGPFQGNHGLGSSLALTDDAVVALICHDGPSYVLAADKATGKTQWKTDYAEGSTWNSPIYSGAQSQLVISSNGRCAAINAKTGKPIWLLEGIEGNTVPSATVADDLVILGSSDVSSNLAIRRGERGTLEDDQIAWRSESGSATFSSPLVYQDHVYVVNRAGVAFCLALKTGETIWKSRIGQSCWASPIGVADRVYFFGKSGRTTVVAAGAELSVLAENELETNDRVYGVAALNGRFVIRTGSQLVCVSVPDDRKENETTSSKDLRKASMTTYPNLPKAITSFGAAIVNDSLYTYGGHHGRAHHYAQSGQSGALRRLDLKAPKAWKDVGDGPKLTGLVLLPHDGKLYRLGGFTARNGDDEDQDLWSRAEFARFDPVAKKWEELPPMPASRSSFDAVIKGDTLYVVGGWTMQGDAETVWRDDALAIDLTQQPLKWRTIAKPPFQRRALSLMALGKKLYAIGGMQSDGEVTTRTAIYDPSEDHWSEGPKLPGDSMEGFGTACAVVGDRLFVSTISGKLLCLSEDGESWQLVRKLPNARFFHRMLTLDDGQLLLIGGANMERGKFSSLEAIEPR